MRGNHKTNKLGTSCQHGTAYIVETRCHPNLPLVIQNVDQCLPKDWVVIIFCSRESQVYASDIKQQVSGRKVIVKLLDDAITSLDDYNNLLFSTAFWEQFETENLLGFQVDSWLSIEQKEVLVEISYYDYVGAPWSEGIQRRWNYIPSYGGNGGVCFSKRSARLNALLYSEQPRVTGEPFNQVLNEDIWFSHAIKSTGGKLPSRNQSIKWFVESVYSKEPFAVHKPWVYLTGKQFLSLCDKNKGLKELKEGCELPMIQSDDYEKEVYRKFLLRFARACLKENNFYQADLALQVCQQRNPSSSVAFNLQALLAYQLGLYDQALSFVNQAIKLQPKFNKAIENRALIKSALSRKAKLKIKNQKTQEKYLLIHSWGSGLGFDLLYLLKQLMVAELTNRKPIVYWGKNSLYNNHPDNDCFTDYFEGISQAALKEIEPFHKDCYPSFWQQRELTDHIRRTRWYDKTNQQNYSMSGLYYLNRDEPLVVGGEFTTIKTLLPWITKEHRFYGLSVHQIYRDLMAKYIKPKAFLQARVNDFINNGIQQKDYIAIHLRGTDKKQEKQSADIASINAELVEQLNKLEPSLPIFVMTDDVRQIELMRDRFGQRVKSIDVTRSDGDEQGVHHTAEDKSKIAQEVIVDMCIAAQATYFLGCGYSYLACCVEVMRGETQSTVLKPFTLFTRFVDIPHQGKFGIE